MIKKFKDFITRCQLRCKQRKENKFLKLFVYYALKFSPMSMMKTRKQLMLFFMKKITDITFMGMAVLSLYFFFNAT